MPLFSRFKTLAVFIAFITAFSMAACTTSNRAKPWDYKTTQAQAQEAPSPLAGNYGNNSGNKSAGRSIMADAATADSVGGPIASPEIQSLPLDAQNANPATANTPPAAATGAPIKVALLLPLSGTNKNLGQSMLKAAQMALFDIGYNGIELLPKDTKGTPDGAQNAAQQALDGGAQLILGPVFSPEVRAAKNVTQRAGVNMISFSTDWTLAGGNTYVMGFLPFDQVERIVGYAQRQGMQHIGVLAPTGDYGNAVVNAYRSITANTGTGAAAVEQFLPGNADMDATVRRFSRYDARAGTSVAGAGLAPPPFDAVLLPVGGDTARTASNMLGQYALPASNVKRLGTGLWDDQILATEPSLNGAWFAAPSPRARASYEERYVALYKSAAPRLSTLAYDATALAAILGRTGQQQMGRPAFDHAAITNPNGFAGIDGIFRFRSNGIAERGLAVLELRGGRPVVIDDAPRTFQQQAVLEQYNRY